MTDSTKLEKPGKKSPARKPRKTKKAEETAVTPEVVEAAPPTEVVEETAPTPPAAKPRARRKKATPKEEAAPAAASEQAVVADAPSAEVAPPPVAEPVVPAPALTFASFGFCEELLKVVAAAGWVEPSPIQAAAIPLAKTGADMVGIAQTGTGKTGAFVLPILDSLKAPSGQIRALIILPTRELAIQVGEDVDKFASALGIKSVVVYGGTAMGLQRLRLRQGVDIVIATPGRLLDLMSQTFIDWSALKFLVLDEADRMLDMGFIPDIERIMRKLPMARQTLLFTATMAPEFKRLAQNYMLYPKEVQIGYNRTVASGVTQWIYPVRQDQKTELLLELFRHVKVKSGIIFCKTKIGTDQLGKALKARGFNVGILHSDRSQGEREKTLGAFREGTIEVLVATDVASRGLDVTGVTHVVNYDVPGAPDDYIHRVGRTARNNATGDAITLVSPFDENSFEAIEKLLKQPLERFVLEGFRYRGERPAGTLAGPLRRLDDIPSPIVPASVVEELIAREDSLIAAEAEETEAGPSGRRRRQRRRRGGAEDAPEAEAQAPAEPAAPVRAPRLVAAAPSEPVVAPAAAAKDAPPVTAGGRRERVLRRVHKERELPPPVEVVAPAASEPDAEEFAEAQTSGAPAGRTGRRRRDRRDGREAREVREPREFTEQVRETRFVPAGNLPRRSGQIVTMSDQEIRELQRKLAREQEAQAAGNRLRVDEHGEVRPPRNRPESAPRKSANSWKPID